MSHKLTSLHLIDIESAGLVVEDAPAGSLSGLASGAAVLAVGTGYHPKLVREVSPISCFSLLPIY